MYSQKELIEKLKNSDGKGFINQLLSKKTGEYFNIFDKRIPDLMRSEGEVLTAKDGNVTTTEVANNEDYQEVIDSEK